MRIVTSTPSPVEGLRRIVETVTARVNRSIHSASRNVRTRARKSVALPVRWLCVTKPPNWYRSYHPIRSMGIRVGVLVSCERYMGGSNEKLSGGSAGRSRTQTGPTSRLARSEYLPPKVTGAPSTVTCRLAIV